MIRRRKSYRQLVVFMSVAMMLSVILTACAGKPEAKNARSNGNSQGAAGGTTDAGKGNTGTGSKPLKISIMLPAYSTDLATKNSPVLKKLDALTHTEVTPIWVPASSYKDKFNITLASGKLPTIMAVLNKSPGFINAAQTGAFWDIGPYLKNYKYLSQANPIVLNNSSINGKIYGVYRSRPLGRYGIILRKDWLANVGLPVPKTVDDFYKVLKAFTERDPNKDHKNDTYGLVLSKDPTALDIMSTWFGVPNKWGLGKDGKLVPAQLTPQYMTALKFFRKLYKEKLINQDFAVLDPAKMDDPVKNGHAGVEVGVLDNDHRLQSAYDKAHPAFAKAHPDGKVTVYTPLGTVAGPDGKRHNLPTSGYAGILAIPKSGVPTEAELKKVLEFLDQLNEPKIQTLLWAGIKGHNYTVKDNYIIRSTDQKLKKEIQDVNQMLMGIPTNAYMDVKQIPLRQEEAKIMKANEKIVVANPAEALVSKVYAQKGTQLDNIVNDARIKYIVGQINEQGFNQAMDLWKKSGGDQYIEEINKLYAAYKKNNS